MRTIGINDSPSGWRVSWSGGGSVTKLSYVHALAHNNLEASTLKYKELDDKRGRELYFQVGDYVWAILTKEKFPTGQ